jgi:hypothetical protein
MKSATELQFVRTYQNLRMRLAGVLSIVNVHSWSDYGLSVANSAANIIGIIAGILVLIAMLSIYFTGSELNQRAREGKIAAPREEDPTKALHKVRAELASARHSEEEKNARLTKIEIELAAAKRSTESTASRLAQLEKELAAARRATEQKALRLSQVEAELAIARHSADEAKATAQQLERGQGPRRITPEQRTQFLNAVRGLPTGKVIVSALFDNKETHEFAAEMLSLLKQDGFVVTQREPTNFFTTSRPSSGVRIGCEDLSNPPPHLATLRQGFKALGVDAPTTTAINAREEGVVEIQLTPRQ